MFIDLRKDFDTVGSDIMLAELKGFVINCTEHKWLSSYLASRSQTIVTGWSPECSTQLESNVSNDLYKSNSILMLTNLVLMYKTVSLW